jgi:hypothetical protein
VRGGLIVRREKRDSIVEVDEATREGLNGLILGIRWLPQLVDKITTVLLRRMGCHKFN